SDPIDEFLPTGVGRLQTEHVRVPGRGSGQIRCGQFELESEPHHASNPGTYRAIFPSRHRLTSRSVSRAIEIIDSTGLVDLNVRSSDGPNASIPHPMLLTT